MMFRKILKVAFIALLLFSMAWILFNAVANLHLHRTSTGNILYHSHPFDRTDQNKPIQGHNHPGPEFLFYAFVSLIEWFIVILILFVAIKKTHTNPTTLFRDPYTPNQRFLIHISRAPPHFNPPITR